MDKKEAKREIYEQNSGAKREPEYRNIDGLAQVQIVDNLIHKTFNLEVSMNRKLKPQRILDGSSMSKYEAEEVNINSGPSTGANQESTGESGNCSKDDIEQGKMVATLNNNIDRLHELQNIEDTGSEEIEKLRDRMYLNILDMKTKLRKFENKQNTLDMTKWQYSLKEMKTEFSNGIEERAMVNHELLQDTKKTKDTMESNMLIAKVKLSKIRIIWNSAEMNDKQRSLDQSVNIFSEKLQERKKIKSKFYGKVTKCKYI